MLNEHRPLKVFLSYTSQDRPVVRELLRRLIGEGWIEPWLDEKNLLPGQDWRLKIEEAVEDSDVVIICLSSNSVTREGYVQKELRYAREMALEKPEGTIFLIPLRLDECEVPRGLRFYQWVDYFGDKKDESYSALVESLKLRHEQRLKLEEVECTRKEKQESDVAERVAHEKAEPDAAEKATHEQSEKDVTPMVRLGAEELVNQKNIRENLPTVLNKIIIGVVGFVVLVLASVFGLPYLMGGPEPTPVATFTKSPALTLTPSVPVSTSTKNPTRGTTKTPIITQTTNVFESTKTSPKDGATMILVPSSGETDSFWIDQKAISMSMFRKFVEETGYITDAEKSGVGFVMMYLGAVPSTQYPGLTGVSYGLKLKSGVNWMTPYSDDMYDNWTFPNTPPAKEYSDHDDVVQVSWNDARAYCAWAGRDLPLQEEWVLAKEIYNESYKLRYKKGEWGDDKVSRISRFVFGFGNDGFVEYRSADTLTFRCKER